MSNPLLLLLPTDERTTEPNPPAARMSFVSPLPPPPPLSNVDFPVVFAPRSPCIDCWVGRSDDDDDGRCSRDWKEEGGEKSLALLSWFLVPIPSLHLSLPLVSPLAKRRKVGEKGGERTKKEEVVCLVRLRRRRESFFVSPLFALLYFFGEEEEKRRRLSLCVVSGGALTNVSFKEKGKREPSTSSFLPQRERETTGKDARGQKTIPEKTKPQFPDGEEKGEGK